MRRFLLGLVSLSLVASAPSLTPAAFAHGGQYRGPAEEVGRGDSALPFPVVGGENGRSAEGWARWEFWFEQEKDALLRRALSAPRGGTPVGPGMPSGGLGGFDPLRPTDLADRTLPAIRAALADPSPEVRMAAALAAGNARDAASLPAIEEMLRRGSRAERRAAALALGFLGDAASLPALERAGSDADPAVRTAALLASGLLGEPSAAAGLRADLERSLGAAARDGRETRVAAVSALGLLRDRASTPLLGRIASSRTLRDDLLRAHALTALGRIGDPAAIPVLLGVLREEPDASIRRSAALALGCFRGPEVEADLLLALEGDSDALVAGYAALSLGRAGGAGAVKALSERTGLRHSRSLRGFAALALGLTDSPATAAPPLRTLLQLRSEDSLRGAASVALGLLGDRDSAGTLRGIASDPSNSPELRGYAVLGASLTGDAAVPLVVKEMLREEGDAAALRGAALAAGVRPFPGSAALLLRVLLEARDPSVRGAAILGLGLAPDRGAVPLLADLSGDAANGLPGERLQAATALGQVALGGALPPAARLREGVDPRALSEGLAEAGRLF